ncbi:zinc-finger domain-containing protein [Bacillus sp. 31A1R]|uniref:Zinc-finger domain-containing protein n=1 Tax=Robertmurraya mangrovi TaxID=3098077 RepID=A0ABU5J1C2_9BACI|nr:zinc-finger domain-containing protein [Bacillus sp. 31A1R]MDZ5473176.1 zinc-finger domain-containing protein [Bacillus sp. 31A1R]
MDRKQILSEVEEMMSSYCKGCFVYKHYKNEKGRRFAHRFCINECTVGEQIKKYGEKLSLSQS